MKQNELLGSGQERANSCILSQPRGCIGAPLAQVRPTPTWSASQLLRPKPGARATAGMANQEAVNSNYAPVVRDTCHGEPQTRNGVAPLHHRTMQQIALQTRPPARRSDKLSCSRFLVRSTSPHSPHTLSSSSHARGVRSASLSCRGSCCAYCCCCCCCCWPSYNPV